MIWLHFGSEFLIQLIWWIQQKKSKLIPYFDLYNYLVILLTTTIIKTTCTFCPLTFRSIPFGQSLGEHFEVLAIRADLSRMWIPNHPLFARYWPSGRDIRWCDEEICNWNWRRMYRPRRFGSECTLTVALDRKKHVIVCSFLHHGHYLRVPVIVDIWIGLQVISTLFIQSNSSFQFANGCLMSALLLGSQLFRHGLHRWLDLRQSFERQIFVVRWIGQSHHSWRSNVEDLRWWNICEFNLGFHFQYSAIFF